MKPSLLARLLTEISLASKLLLDVAEDQWEKGVSPPAKVGSTTPARTHPPRPVEDIVTNEPRLALREAVHQLEMEIATSEERIASARRRVERAHRVWKGLDPDDEPVVD